ncbi:MAG: hypothetical protein PHO89_11480, partial [Methylacidiphilaceae bacterium]|nr:hypothetical protein [Candidatus Methylacidiphilaceae bacterium]
MKIITAAAILGVLLASANAAQPIAKTKLRTGSVATVEVDTSHVTTLSFPAPVTALWTADAAYDSTPTRRKNLPTLAIDWQKGSSNVTLRAVLPAVDTNLNVGLGKDVYVLRVITSQHPQFAVHFLFGDPVTGAGGAALAGGLPTIEEQKAMMMTAERWPVLQ